MDYLFQHIKENNNFKNLINGQWIGTSDSINISCPYQNFTLGSIPKMTKEDIDKLIKYAKEGEKTWSYVEVKER